jgi:hypothetical protein
LMDGVMGVRLIPVFVAKGTDPLPPGWVQRSDYTSEHMFEVTTSVDGEVLDFQVHNSGYLVQPWYSPSDIYNAAKILVNFARIGVRVAWSGVRKGTAGLAGRSVLRGPTASLAQEVGNKVASAPKVINVTAKARLAEAYAKTSPEQFAKTLQAEVNAGVKAEAQAGTKAEAKAGVKNAQATQVSEAGFTPLPEAEAAVSRELAARRLAFSDDLMREISTSVKTRGYGLEISEYNAAWDRLSAKWGYPFGNL